MWLKRVATHTPARIAKTLVMRVAFGALLIPALLPAQELVAEPYITEAAGRKLKTCTHIAFLNGYEFVTDLGNDRILYRKAGSTDPLEAAAWIVNGPHSVSTMGGYYIVDDTENNRIAAYSDFNAAEPIIQADFLGGVSLERPHDVVFDPWRGCVYALNPNEPKVMRFTTLSGDVDVLDLSSELNYSRGLTVTGGKLYVVGSSLGKVIEVDDFDSAKYTVHTGHGKVAEAPAGNWTKTGLVLNDVDMYAGSWYATCFFSPKYSDPTQDCNKNKLIRFKTWQDFETGTWEDLSSLLPADIVPYFLTPYGDSLYLGAFYDEDNGPGDVIFRLKPKS